jgi:hypothetical protein
MKKGLFSISYFFTFLALLIGAVFLTDKLILIMISDNFLFFEHSPLASNLIAPIIAFPAFIITDIIFFFLSGKKYDPLNLISLLKWLGRWNIVPTLIWVLCFYYCIITTTTVTEDKIITKSFFNPSGKEYTYSQVEKIETGFGDKKLTFWEHKRKGSFYYSIYLDGKKFIFHQPDTNENIPEYEDSYIELEYFDQKLVENNIPKISSEKNADKCNFDQRYKDRFLRIINLK